MEFSFVQKNHKISFLYIPRLSPFRLFHSTAYFEAATYKNHRKADIHKSKD